MELEKLIRLLQADNQSLRMTLTQLQNENEKLKHDTQAISRNAYMRGWNECRKKMKNFIIKHLEDWKEPYEN